MSATEDQVIDLIAGSHNTGRKLAKSKSHNKKN